MVSVVVRTRGGTDPQDRIDGMVVAGETINKLVATGYDAVDIFGELYKKLAMDAAEADKVLFLANSTAHGGEQELTPLPDNKPPKNKYSFGEDPAGQLQIKPSEDDSGDHAGGKVKKMAFVVPGPTEGSTLYPDMLANGYVNVIAEDCERILLGLTYDDTNARHVKLKRYLLANVFLSRCH